MNRITSIVENEFRVDGTLYMGYTIGVNNDPALTILVGVEEAQQCCEEYGYIESEDDVQDFVGTDLIGVTVVDTCLISHKVPDIYEGDAVYVNLVTRQGDLQFTLYNSNSNYGHEVVVRSPSFNFDRTL